MRTILVSVALVALSVSFVPAVAGQSVADEVAIREANEQRIAVWNAKDEKAYLPFFDKDCTSDWVGDPCAAGAFPEESKNARIRILEDRGIVFVTADVAIHRYTFEGSGGLDAAGKPQPPISRERASVFVKKGGKWLQAARFTQIVEQ